MNKIEETTTLWGMKVAKKQNAVYAKDLGEVLAEHEDLKRFLRSRLIMQVTPLKIEQTKKGDAIQLEVSQGYNMVYNCLSLFERIKFFVFDVSLWFRTKYGKVK